MSSMESQENSQSMNTTQKVSVRDRLSHFTWSWFECTMSTGAIGTLLAQQPYSFDGLEIIGKIFFILDLVLFLTFCILITFRFSMKPSALGRSLHHPQESFFFGTFLVSIALILYCTQEYGVPSSGPWLVYALKVCFWIYAGMALITVIFQYHVIFDTESLPVYATMPAWILPAYPFLILGPLAAVLEYNQPPDAALPIFIGGIVFQGLGWTIAFLMYTLYFTRMISHELPEESKRPGMFVAVGPASYTSNALVALAMQAPKVIPDHFLGLTTIPAGELWKGIGVPIGIFLWLVGFWFFAMATISVLSGIRKIHFTLNYWAFIFPNVGLTIALIQIGNALDSAGIKGICSAMSILLVAMWLFVATMNIRALWLGQVLWPGLDEDEEDIEGHPHAEKHERLD